MNLAVAGSEETSFCQSTLPGRLPSVRSSRSRCESHGALPPLPVGEPGFEPRLVPGTKTGKEAPPGFPTLKTLELDAALKLASVEVLGQPSKKESLILTIKVLFLSGNAERRQGQWSCRLV